VTNRTSAITSATTALNAAIAAEVTRASAAEAVNASAITAEATAARAAELVLTNGLAAEVTRASAAEAANASAITAEATAARAAELVLTNGLAGEVTRASAAEAANASAITAEASRAAAAEAANASAITAEASRAAAAEGVLTTYNTNLYAALHDAANDPVARGQFNIKINGHAEGQYFAAVSDARLKKDVEEVGGALELVSKLHPVYYNWVDDREKINPSHKELGFLAQEIEEFLPGVVHTTSSSDGDVSNVKRVVYDRVVALLCAAVKELKSEVEALKRA
jgi:hypothetical protein